MKVRGRVAIAGCAAICWSLLATGYAGANFPGSNGKIEFSEQTSLGPTVEARIVTMNPDGSGVTPLTPADQANLFGSYSADGEKIVFVRVTGTPPSTLSSSIWVMDHDGSDAEQLTSEVPNTILIGPQFSPDGSRIVFGRQVGGPGGLPQVYIMNADGSGETQLTFPGPSGNDAGLFPTFSPDGRKIAFGRGDGSTGFVGIATMNPDGSDVTPVTTGSATQLDNEPDFSPDGRRIVFERSDPSDSSSGRLVVMDADGSNQSTLVTPQGDEVPRLPVFSPDGTRVAFSRINLSSPTPSSRIELADSSGTDQGLTPLTGGSTLAAYPGWQPLNAPTCDLAGAAKQKSVKKINLTVTCQGENATVVAEGTGQAPKVPRAGATASKKKRFKIPAVTTQVPASSPTTITLKISKKGSKALKKAAKAGKKGKATITATATDDLGRSTTETFAVKFKKKKK